MFRCLRIRTAKSPGFARWIAVLLVPSLVMDPVFASSLAFLQKVPAPSVVPQADSSALFNQQAFLLALVGQRSTRPLVQAYRSQQIQRWAGRTSFGYRTPDRPARKYRQPQKTPRGHRHVRFHTEERGSEDDEVNTEGEFAELRRDVLDGVYGMLNSFQIKPDEVRFHPRLEAARILIQEIQKDFHEIAEEFQSLSNELRGTHPSLSTDLDVAAHLLLDTLTPDETAAHAGTAQGMTAIRRDRTLRHLRALWPAIVHAHINPAERSLIQGRLISAAHGLKAVDLGPCDAILQSLGYGEGSALSLKDVLARLHDDPHRLAPAGSEDRHAMLLVLSVLESMVPEAQDRRRSAMKKAEHTRGNTDENLPAQPAPEKHQLALFPSAFKEAKAPWTELQVDAQVDYSKAQKRLSLLNQLIEAASTPKNASAFAVEAEVILHAGETGRELLHDPWIKILLTLGTPQRLFDEDPELARRISRLPISLSDLELEELGLAGQFARGYLMQALQNLGKTQRHHAAALPEKIYNTRRFNALVRDLKTARRLREKAVSTVDILAALDWKPPTLSQGTKNLASIFDSLSYLLTHPTDEAAVALRNSFILFQDPLYRRAGVMLWAYDVLPQPIFERMAESLRPGILKIIDASHPLRPVDLFENEWEPQTRVHLLAALEEAFRLPHRGPENPLRRIRPLLRASTLLPQHGEPAKPQAAVSSRITRPPSRTQNVGDPEPRHHPETFIETHELENKYAEMAKYGRLLRVLSGILGEPVAKTTERLIPHIGDRMPEGFFVRNFVNAMIRAYFSVNRFGVVRMRLEDPLDSPDGLGRIYLFFPEMGTYVVFEEKHLASLEWRFTQAPRLLEKRPDEWILCRTPADIEGILKKLNPILHSTPTLDNDSNFEPRRSPAKSWSTAILAAAGSSIYALGALSAFTPTDIGTASLWAWPVFSLLQIIPSLIWGRPGDRALGWIDADGRPRVAEALRPAGSFAAFIAAHERIVHFPSTTLGWETVWVSRLEDLLLAPLIDPLLFFVGIPADFLTSKLRAALSIQSGDSRLLKLTTAA